MNENQALRRVVLSASNSVPLGARLWCCFKRYVLEKPLVRATYEVPLTETAFRQKVRPVLRKSGPVELRGGSRTARRLERDSLGVLWRYYLCILDPASPLRLESGARGLGLYARRRLDTQKLPKELFGAVASLDEPDFDMLVDAKYPSLYQTGKVNGLLFGVMSLVNHSCGATIRFTNLIPRGRPEGFDGFGIIRLKSNGKKRTWIEPSQEILVNYGMRTKGFVCECESCSK